MPLKLMYITNDPSVAAIAQKYGVERIWVDLETLGKEQRQHGLDTVKSRHCIADIPKVKSVLSSSELLVRINGWNDASPEEVDEVIAAGADMIMLPMWKSAREVREFLRAVGGRAKTTLLLETAEAENCLDEALAAGGFDEIHIGLNDLHLSYGLTFMFELLANGTVERICSKLKRAGVPFGFGGIARIGEGTLPSERIVLEHYRLGSTRAILSRSFCNAAAIKNPAEVEAVFKENVAALRAYEEKAAAASAEEKEKNRKSVCESVSKIVEDILRRDGGHE